MKILLEFTEVYQNNAITNPGDFVERKVSVDPRYVHFVRDLDDETDPSKCVIVMGTAVFLHVKESYAEVVNQLKMY